MFYKGSIRGLGFKVPGGELLVWAAKGRGLRILCSRFRVWGFRFGV